MSRISLVPQKSSEVLSSVRVIKRSFSLTRKWFRYWITRPSLMLSFGCRAHCDFSKSEDAVFEALHSVESWLPRAVIDLKRCRTGVLLCVCTCVLTLTHFCITLQNAGALRNGSARQHVGVWACVCMRKCVNMLGVYILWRSETLRNKTSAWSSDRPAE